MSAADTTVHASAVLIGDRAVLIRGPSGSGKSRLAFGLILAGRARQIPAAILIGDDRVHLDRQGDTLTVRPAAALSGLIELHGLGIRRIDHAAHAAVGLVVDLAACDAARLPESDATHVIVGGVRLPRIPGAAGHDALPLVMAAIITSAWHSDRDAIGDCADGLR